MICTLNLVVWLCLSLYHRDPAFIFLLLKTNYMSISIGSLPDYVAIVMNSAKLGY